MSGPAEMGIVKISPPDNEREKWAKEQIAALQREYQERAQPFIEILAQEDRIKPARYFIKPLSQ